MRRRFFQTHKNNVENLTLVSLEDNNEIYLNVSAIGITGEIEMKISGDYKWMPTGAVILNKGDFIEYRGTISNISAGQDRIGTFVISKKVNLYGDCTSILKDRMLFNNSLAHLFENTPVVNIHSTFLPATTLAVGCYDSMFRGCTSLTTAPELPATTLVDNCYQFMFEGCTSLTSAPELPATTLAVYCYQFMFYGCTSLTTTPELPATTLAKYCYQYMFYNCKNLNYIKMLATDISATNCLSNWVSGVASTGTFVKHPDMNSLPTGSSGIPSGWTVVNDGEESGGGKIENYLRKGKTSLTKQELTLDFPAETDLMVYYTTSHSGSSRSIFPKGHSTLFIGLGPGDSIVSVDRLDPNEDDVYIYKIDYK